MAGTVERFAVAAFLVRIKLHGCSLLAAGLLWPGEMPFALLVSRMANSRMKCNNGPKDPLAVIDIDLDTVVHIYRQPWTFKKSLPTPVSRLKSPLRWWLTNHFADCLFNLIHYFYSDGVKSIPS